MARAWRAGIIALGLLASGCHSPSPSPPQPAGIKHRKLAELPKIGDYQPPLDGQLLEAAPPLGWYVMPRHTSCLIGFSKGKRGELPRITINARDPPAGCDADLTEETAPALAAKIDQELRPNAAERPKHVAESCLPIILGDTVFVRHVRHVRFRNDGPNCVVQSLETVKNSRRYTVELIVEINAPKVEQYHESLIEYRDYGYAVAANMRFAPPGKTFDLLEGVKAAPATDSKSPPHSDKEAAGPKPAEKHKTEKSKSEKPKAEKAAEPDAP
jgi:hypothetical protein